MSGPKGRIRRVYRLKAARCCFLLVSSEDQAATKGCGELIEGDVDFECQGGEDSYEITTERYHKFHMFFLSICNHALRQRDCISRYHLTRCASSAKKLS